MTDRLDYKVELDTYSGPLDLLLYLIRQAEVDLWNLPIARITEQYLRYMELMTELNINVAGEFIVMAAQLIEIKSRMMTPEPEPMPEEEPDDPRMELVRQLLEYKRFKEAALALNDRAELQSERFARPGERPDGTVGPVSGAPAGVSLWTLFEAFSKILQQTGGGHELVFDPMPQERIQRELEETMRTAGRLTFVGVFQGQMTRLRLIGTFIALLELVKQQVLHVEQAEAFGEIWLTYVPPEERVQAAPPLPPEPAPESPPPAPAAEPDEPADDEWPDEDSSIVLPDVPSVDEPLPAPPPDDADEQDEEDEDETDDEDEDEDEDETDDEDEGGE
ncbi:MAG: segregation/condensation protein A [Candidatus Brocadiia bacterium]|jgi:segregation and condensation protein A